MLDQAIDIRKRAEIRGGEILIQMKATGERHSGENAQNLRGSQAATPVVQTLSDLGISKTDSSRWQKLAALLPKEQEEKIQRERSN
jgi:hypothetical protein